MPCSTERMLWAVKRSTCREAQGPTDRAPEWDDPKLSGSQSTKPFVHSRAAHLRLPVAGTRRPGERRRGRGPPFRRKGKYDNFSEPNVGISVLDAGGSRS